MRLLGTWCDCNCHSRQFLLGSALLHMGEPEKACDWMVDAAGGIPGDRFLLAQLFTRQELSDCGENLEKLQVLYFLKIIRLFEQFGYNDFVIELANTALDICDEGDPNRVKNLSSQILGKYPSKL